MKFFGMFSGCFVLLGCLALIPLGCSGGDNDIVIPADDNLATRVNVFSVGEGTLALLPQSAEEGGSSATDQGSTYSLTLNDVSQQILWYTERPARETGTVTVQAYVDSWTKMYGTVSPNAVLDGTPAGETENRGLYLKLEQPLYDAQTNRLTFQVTLLGSTMDDPHPVAPVEIVGIKMTVLNNTPAGEDNAWFYGQSATGAVFQPTGTDGLYTLYLNNVYSELYEIQNAPGSLYEISTQPSLVRNWMYYFSDVPPNASLSAYTETDELQLVVVEIDNPSYQDGNFSYEATVLSGDVVPNGSLRGATLLIDSPQDTVPVCSTTGSQAACYDGCFSGFNPICCPVGSAPYPCAKDTSADQCSALPPECHSGGQCTDSICTTKITKTDEPTEITIRNNSGAPVEIAFTTGAETEPGKLGACMDPGRMISYQDIADANDWCKNPTASGGGVNAGHCKGTIPTGTTVVKRPANTGNPRCLNGNVSVNGPPSCPDATSPNGTTQVEFTLNPTHTTTEGTNISLVNGVNYAMSINVPGEHWYYGTPRQFVTKTIGPNGAKFDPTNRDPDNPGIFPVGCTDCIQLVNAPVCPEWPNPPTCRTPVSDAGRTCVIQRDVVTGGTLEIIIGDEIK